MTFLELLKEFEISNNNNYENSEEVKNNHNLFLIFILDNEVYAISADKIEELIPLEHIIIINNGPDYKKGLIRYKDSLIEAIDLRLRLNIKPKNYDYKSTIVVTKKNNNLIGLIVDDVIDYSTIFIENENFSKNYISKKETDYFIEGFIKDNKASIKLLNMDNILNMD